MGTKTKRCGIETSSVGFAATPLNPPQHLLARLLPACLQQPGLGLCTRALTRALLAQPAVLV